MLTVPSDAIQPGMVLADDIYDFQGRFILGKGVELNEKHLRIIKTWGLTEISIVDEEGPPPAVPEADSPYPQLTQRIEDYLRSRLRFNNFDNPVITELVRCCSTRLLKSHNTVDEIENFIDDLSAETKPLDDIFKQNNRIDPYKFILKDIQLPSLPTTFYTLSEVIERPFSSAYDISNVISKDTALAAKLLKIVNSPFYGFPSKIDTLSRAVSIVGTKQLCALAMGIAIINSFKDIPSELIDMKRFWQHSIATGICARMLATYKKYPDTERIFVAGLLHDIGRLVLYQYLGKRSREILNMANDHGELLYVCEKASLGFDHATIGGILMEKWKLPITLEHTVNFHHRPSKSRDLLEASLIHIADIVVNSMGVGSSGEKYVPPMSEEAWCHSGLPKSIFSSTMLQVDVQLESVTRFLFSDE